MRRPLITTTMLLAGAAAAQTSPWYVGAGLTLTQESNIYRLPDGAATPPGVSKSDRVTSAALLAGLDQAVGRQRLYGNATLRSNRYQDNPVLDYEGYALRAGLDWSTAERLSGNVDLRADRGLRFESGQQGGRNVETGHQASAVVRLGVVTVYTAEASLEHRRIDYSAPAFDDRDNRQNAVSLGLRWRPSGGTVLGAGLRHVRGEYPRFSASGSERYARNGLDLVGGLDLSGASRIDARLNLGRTRHEQATQRDFSGVTGSLSWDWRPTAKLRLVTRASRDSGQDSYSGRSADGDGVVDVSRTTTALGLRAEYAASAKVRINAGVNLARRDLVGKPPDGGRAREHATEPSLGLAWEPTRSLVFGCDAGHEKRSVSGDLSAPYSAARFGCYGQVFLR
jgi:hypothetical protein